jgi:NADPH:quinone reductase-like Zn-dependent oxidoreductase
LTSHRLGLEVAGSVVRTGRLVKHLQVGDEVMALISEDAEAAVQKILVG